MLLAQLAAGILALSMKSRRLPQRVREIGDEELGAAIVVLILCTSYAISRVSPTTSIARRGGA